MTISLQFYLDPNLNALLSGPLLFEQNVNAEEGPIKVVYLGSKIPNRKFEATQGPGTWPISLAVVDAQPGIGQEVSSIKLSLDPAELPAMIPGIGLMLPATIISGEVNAIPIYIQANDKTGIVGSDNSLSLVTNNIIETENV